MKERPLLYSGPMVIATLENRKTNTRRTRGLDQINERPDQFTHATVCDDGITWLFWPTPSHGGGTAYYIKCPYGKGGDRLWVRETWSTLSIFDHLPPSDIDPKARIEYAADGKHASGKTRASIHMPRWASRLDLDVTGIRPERLQCITEEDAIKEGAVWMDTGKDKWNQPRPGWSMFHPHPSRWEQCNGTARSAFGHYINTLHGGKNWNLKPTNLWDRNPWVWVIEFQKHHPRRPGVS